MANAIVDLRVLGVIGTGDFGLAISKRLLRAGYNVIIGSRFPEERDLAKRDRIFAGVDVVSIEECIKTATMLVFAIHKKHFNSLLEFQDILSGKVVIDVSNQDKRDRNESNAEYLASMFPQTCFVKAFNVVSAYNMENIGYCTEEKRVYVASDNPEVRHVICEMVKLLGFVPVDMGRLRMSRGIEKMPIRLFSGWGGSFLITLLIFVVWFIYAVFKFYVRMKIYDGAQFPLKVLNKPICMTAITLLAITYLPSSVAGMTQIYYGTRHKRFPRWLDKWLKARKSLGLIALFLVFIHIMMSTLTMGPTYYSDFYVFKSILLSSNNSELFLYQPGWMLWQAEVAMLLGIIALMLLLILGLSAIPSVAHTLNWREWRFVQSGCGHVALFFCIAHAIFRGLPNWAKATEKVHVLDSLAFLAIIIPVLTLLFKLFMIMPCIANHLHRIRQGFDREDSIDTKEDSKSKPHDRKKFRRKRKSKERDVYTHPPVADLQDIP